MELRHHNAFVLYDVIIKKERERVTGGKEQIDI